MNRKIKAFVIAPLWVPLVVTPLSAILAFPYPEGIPWIIVTGALSALFAYLGSWGIGFPLFNFLISRRIVSAWAAPIAGTVIAVITWIVFLLCFAVSLDGFAVGIGTFLNTPILGWYLVAVALLGTTIGLTIWGIARPDKELAPPQL